MVKSRIIQLYASKILQKTERILLLALFRYSRGPGGFNLNIPKSKCDDAQDPTCANRSKSTAEAEPHINRRS